jgi:hypothetical protein
MNGYAYPSGYDPNGMPADPHSMDVMMAQGGQDGTGMTSLEDIVSQNSKVIRRQSMPQGYGANPPQVDTDMRRISMLDYSGASPAPPMNGYGYDPNGGMDHQNNMMGSSTSHPGPQHRNGQSRRDSNENLAINTTFGGTSQYNGPLMPPNTAFASPAHPQNGLDLGMNSPYVDPNLSMTMDFTLDPNMGGAMGNDSMSMNLYNQPQFSNSVVNSPVHATAQHATPNAVRAPSSQDFSGGSSGMNTQYNGHGSNSGGSTVRALSRAQSMHQMHEASPSNATPSSRPAPTAQTEQAGNTPSGFRGQPQHPQPGSSQDRGVWRESRNGTQSQYDGVTGPVPVNPQNYNPNNQGFAWDTPEGGWPSTMVGRPHMQSNYKNAYSSTGFDMLGVLVCILSVCASSHADLPRCAWRHALIPKSTLVPLTSLVPSSYAMLRRTTSRSCTARTTSSG